MTTTQERQPATTLKAIRAGAIAVTNGQGVTVTTRPVNLSRTGWSFSATDAHGYPIRLGSVLHIGLTEFDAERHARYLAERIGDAGTHAERRLAIKLRRYPH